MYAILYSRQSVTRSVPPIDLSIRNTSFLVIYHRFINSIMQCNISFYLVDLKKNFSRIFRHVSDFHGQEISIFT